MKGDCTGGRAFGKQFMSVHKLVSLFSGCEFIMTDIWCPRSVLQFSCSTLFFQREAQYAGKIRRRAGRVEGYGALRDNRKKHQSTYVSLSKCLFTSFNLVHVGIPRHGISGLRSPCCLITTSNKMFCIYMQGFAIVLETSPVRHAFFFLWRFI